MHHVQRFDRLASTQDEIHRLAAAGAPAGTLVVAEEQGAGRGARGRPWSSARGGLWLTLLCRPEDGAGAELLSLRAGLAAAEALDELGGLPPIALKWPNDLVADGRKLGGILCEARWQGTALEWVAVGLGINVRNPLPDGARMAPTRVAEWRPNVDVDDLLWPLLARLVPLARGGPAQLSPAELATFARRDWLAGRTLLAPVAGAADGVAPDGALRVRRADGTLATIRSGDATPAVTVAPGGTAPPRAR
ncbi:MAG TPA: biotin--[acetyl-CoA-carboxylase] ligase [Gemmatimonadales bacterium]|nr:biotin--[acetyl-CoA-carboxylase] ligase [Gemmatimonadales bacterium]